MREPWRTVFLLFVILFTFGMTRACDTEVGAVGEIPQPITLNKNTTIDLIATSDDGKVKYYRLTDIPDGYVTMMSLCYITVGELHGKTVTMECK